MSLKKINSKEVRSVDMKVKDNLILEGTPIVFNESTEVRDQLGSYTEVIEAKALEGTDLSDVKLLYNHDMNGLPLARTPGTMKLDVNDKGLSMRAELPDTEQGRSVHTATKRGDLSGMSFSFTVSPGGDHFDKETNTRTISKIDKVLEVSITPFPAYEQTSLSARSKSISKPGVDDLKIKINQILFKGDDY